MPLTISSLHVYPVKGLKGISLEEVRCTARGLEHDRRWMVVDRDDGFVSQREVPRMATIWTELGDGVLNLAAPDMDPIDVAIEPEAPATTRVRVWNSVCDAALAAGPVHQWLSDYLGMACRLVYLPESSHRYSNPARAGEGREVGFADGYAYLLIGQASLDDLNARLAAKSHPALPMNRFRPNIVFTGGEPYAEDRWREFGVGEARLRMAKPCGRCQVTTTDQSSGERRGPEPLATLATFRDSREFGTMFGMNAVTLREGRVRVGDAIQPD